MCGRYALALRLSQIRRMLQDDDMPVWEAPEDDAEGAPRQSYNFAPGYHGVVYRADTPDWGAGPRRSHQGGAGAASSQEDTAADHDQEEDEPAAAVAPAEGDEAPPLSSTHGEEEGVHYKLQSMKWGLIPFWTKRNPDYGSVLRTINCRDDSLSAGGGMWTTMKKRKRCVVIAQGFYEWLKVGKERVPYYIRRKDGHLLYLAGLWDVVQYEDDATNNDDAAAAKHYTYTIITTDANPQLKFLHDRMPVILDPGSDKMKTWLDPGRYEWTKELQAILRPWDGELEIYAVSKEVNKVGNNSPSFIIPVASKENKSNIANFFANAKAKKEGGVDKLKKPEVEVKEEEEDGMTSLGKTKTETKDLDEVAPAAAAPKPGTKRAAHSVQGEPLKKLIKTTASPSSSPTKVAGRQSKISATSNGSKSLAKSKANGSQKITKFFSNSA